MNVAASCANVPFSVEVLACAKGYSAYHFLSEGLRVCMFVYAHSRQTNGSLFSASHQCALEAKQDSQPRKHPYVGLVIYGLFPGLTLNGECIGRIRPG